MVMMSSCCADSARARVSVHANRATLTSVSTGPLVDEQTLCRLCPTYQNRDTNLKMGTKHIVEAVRRAVFWPLGLICKRRDRNCGCSKNNHRNFITAGRMMPSMDSSTCHLTLCRELHHQQHFYFGTPRTIPDQTNVGCRLILDMTQANSNARGKGTCSMPRNGRSTWVRDPRGLQRTDKG